MDKKLFEEYAAIKVQIAQLTKEAKEKEGKLRNDMLTEETDKVTTDVGTFSISTRKTYNFSPLVKEMEQSVKDTKQDEIMTGKASIKDEKTILTFRAKK